MLRVDYSTKIAFFSGQTKTIPKKRANRTPLLLNLEPIARVYHMILLYAVKLTQLTHG